MTATQLFAGISGFGDFVCFFCGGRCSDAILASEFVKPSFTGLDTVTLSKYVCGGCVASMGEREAIELIGGEVRSGQKVRGYSWVITADWKRAATKAHRNELLSLCLYPPDPPFVICLTDSGQKHLLYRSVVNHEQSVVTVTLEGELITYFRPELADRSRLCRQICAATGKPALSSTLDVQSQMRVVDHFGSDVALAEWLSVADAGLSRLAAWLCPPKEDCLYEFPAVCRAAS